MADLKKEHIDDNVKQGFYLSFEKSQEVLREARIKAINKEIFVKTCFELGYEIYKTNYELFEKKLSESK